jgi:hypothetical protein
VLLTIDQPNPLHNGGYMAFGRTTDASTSEWVTAVPNRIRITAVRILPLSSEKSCASTIWSFRYDGQQISAFTNRSNELEPPGADTFTFLAGFGQDGFGKLYIIDWHWDEALGEVYKILPDPSDVDHEHSITADLIQSVSPEPFSSRTSIWMRGSSSAPVVLEIIDTSGRRVWQQTVGLPEGSHRIEWYGTDASGSPVPSGVYYLLARQADRIERRTLHLIR